MCGGSDDEQRLEVFLEAMMPADPPRLRALERRAREEGVPVIRPQTRNILRFFISLQQPASILEIGAAVGFSALFMQEYAPRGCRIVTIESDPARARKAMLNFSGYGNEIRLLEGDAADILPTIREDASFDMIFMDAAKGQYIRFLPEALRLLREGGILLTDNILREGEILSSRFAVNRRNRTIHSRMRAYLRALMEEPGLETLLLSDGDGTAVSVRRRRPGNE